MSRISCQVGALLLLLPCVASGANGWFYNSGFNYGTTAVTAPSASFSTTYDTSGLWNINTLYSGTFANSSFTYGDQALGGAYTGPGYAGQNAFFNQFTGGTFSPQMTLRLEIDGDPTAVQIHRVLSGTESAFQIGVTENNAVESIRVITSYEGPSGYFSPGFTGRQTTGAGSAGGITPGVPNRPAMYVRAFGSAANPNSVELTGVSTGNWETTPSGFGHVPEVFTAGDFDAVSSYVGFQNTAPTIGAGGNSAFLTGDNVGLWYHNGSDLGDLLQSITVDLSAPGATFTSGSNFLFSIDAMAPIIPEPSRALLLSAGLFVLILRRRR